MSFLNRGKEIDNNRNFIKKEEAMIMFAKSAAS